MADSAEEVLPTGGHTSSEAIAVAHAQLVATFKTGRTKAYEWRMKQLNGLRQMCTECSDAMCEALRLDLGRPKAEASIADVVAVVVEIDFALKHLESWMRPTPVPQPLTTQPGRSLVLREPKGVVLQIAPWNFPVNLTLMGLIAAISAGNCCLVKPSEISAHTEQLLKKLLPRYLDPEAIIVVTGGVREATALLDLRWDHILYTGNGAVARIVMKAAAAHLTPCTLELGGKTPTVVLPGANLPVAARRILNAKCLNAGQICVAPDYALCHESVEEALVQEMQKTLKNWFGEDASASSSFGRIVNEGHFRRVRNLIDTSGGDVLPQLGSLDEASKFIPPTLIRNPSSRSPIMQEEIFGPVFPIVKKGSVAEIIEYINAGEKPLALYIFGSVADADEVIKNTSSGGVCVNDTIFHMTNPGLPFGGVGESGMGKYHGQWGFDEFSNMRAVMYRATWIDPPQRYPPYTEMNMKLLERLFIGPILPPAVKKAVATIGAGVLAGGVAMVMRSRL